MRGDVPETVLLSGTSHGLYRYGPYSYGLCSYVLYSYGPYSSGLYSYGPYTYGPYIYVQDVPETVLLSGIMLPTTIRLPIPTSCNPLTPSHSHKCHRTFCRSHAAMDRHAGTRPCTQAHRAHMCGWRYIINEINKCGWRSTVGENQDL